MGAIQQAWNRALGQAATISTLGAGIKEATGIVSESPVGQQIKAETSKSIQKQVVAKGKELGLSSKQLNQYQQGNTASIKPQLAADLDKAKQAIIRSETQAQNKRIQQAAFQEIRKGLVKHLIDPDKVGGTENE